jgi:erythromycin esterase-like protein
MWRNREFDALVQWLRTHNEPLPLARRAGLFGLDLYSLGASMRAVIDYLDRVDPESAQVARNRYGCLTPWTREPAEYGRLAMRAGHAVCEAGVVQMLVELLERRREYLARDDGPGESHEFFDAAQNARLVRNAEQYYRTMYHGAAESWNQRDRHMFQTLQHLLEAGGRNAKAVVWAHNSHIGDARHTDMASRGELNLGQLCRERYEESAVAIGFGTHAGSVAAASDWDEPMEVMQVRPSLPGSVERACHAASELPEATSRWLLDLRAGVHDAVRADFDAQRLERFIGVVYRPETERLSHYMRASLPKQFDAYVWFDTSRAVDPLPARAEPGRVPDTWPFGL